MNKLAALLSKLSALSNTAKVAVAVGSVAVVGTTGATVNYVVKEQEKKEAIQEVMDTIETGLEDSFSLKDSTITIEYGTSISSDLNDYVDLPDEIMANITFSLDFSNEDGKEYPAVGEYKGTISYKEANLDIQIEVKDTTAPEFVDFMDELTFSIGEELDLKSIFTILDLSEVTLDQEGTYDANTEGEYPIKVIATDLYGNETVKEVTIIFKEKATTSTSGSTTGSYTGGCTGSVCGGSDTPYEQNWEGVEGVEKTADGVYYSADYRLIYAGIPFMYRGKIWTHQEYCGYLSSDNSIPPTPEEMSYSAGDGGKVFKTLNEAQNWARAQLSDPESEWYGYRTFVAQTVSFITCGPDVDTKNPWIVHFIKE